MKTKTRKHTYKRCATGLSLLGERAKAVNASAIETWNKAEADGYLVYMQHEKTCPYCRAYFYHTYIKPIRKQKHETKTLLQTRTTR